MRRFQFVHAAGLRLCAPFEGVGRVPSRVADGLCDASLVAWDSLIDFCARKRASFLVISGGIDAPAATSLRGRIRFRSGLQRLSDQGIHTFLALAPDDGEIADLLARDCPAAVTVFASDRAQTVAFERDGSTLAWVSGQSGVEPHPLSLGTLFDGAPEGATPLIGVVSCAVDQLESALVNAPRKASYWAVGHAALPSRRGFSPWIVEAGELQARSPVAGRQASRGAMLVEVEGGRVLAVDHTDLDHIRYVATEVSPNYAIGDALLQHQLLDALNRLRATHSGRGLVVDITLVPGTIELGEPGVELDRATSRLREALRLETEQWDPFVWCNKITVGAPAVATLALGEPLDQAIVQESRALLSNPMQRSVTFARRFEPLMRRWTSELDSDGAQRLVEEATALALRQAVCTDKGA